MFWRSRVFPQVPPELGQIPSDHTASRSRRRRSAEALQIYHLNFQRRENPQILLGFSWLFAQYSGSPL